VGADAGAGWRHEAQVLARCADHGNVVTLYEVIEDAHYVYIIMEECEGNTPPPYIGPRQLCLHLLSHHIRVFLVPGC
jgi:serine/threonine protein kinase